MLIQKLERKIMLMILEQLHVLYSSVKLIFIAQMQVIPEEFYQEETKESLD